MDRNSMTTIARLREMLATFEADLGIGPRTNHEVSILYAMHLVSEAAGEIDVAVRDVRSHVIVQNMSQPTFNRALRNLVENGDVCPSPHFKARYYRICLDFTW